VGGGHPQAISRQETARGKQKGKESDGKITNKREKGKKTAEKKGGLETLKGPRHET